MGQWKRDGKLGHELVQLLGRAIRQIHEILGCRVRTIIVVIIIIVVAAWQVAHHGAAARGHRRGHTCRTVVHLTVVDQVRIVIVVVDLILLQLGQLQLMLLQLLVDLVLLVGLVLVHDDQWMMVAITGSIHNNWLPENCRFVVILIAVAVVVHLLLAMGC